MADELAEREQRMAIALRQESHQERMAALGTLAANFAHEIGNPVATVSALAQDIRGRPEADATSAEQARLIVEQCERIAGMTRHVSDMATPQAGVVRPTDLNALTRTVCDFLRFDPRLRRLRIDVALAKDLPPALATPDHMVQALMDTIVAAVERVPEDALRGALEVRSGRDAKGLFVRIRPAVAAESAPAAFADQARIALARHLARSMRGDLELARTPVPEVTVWVPPSVSEGGA